MMMRKPWLILCIASASLVLFSFTQLARTSYFVFYRNIHNSSPQRRRLGRYADGKSWRMISDPRTVDPKDTPVIFEVGMPPLDVCERPAPIQHDVDMRMMKRYGGCDRLNRPPKETAVLVLDGVITFGQTGNNLIEFFHALQYARDHSVLVAIEHGSWAPQMISNMWMAVQNDDILAWRNFFERAFCVKVFHRMQELAHYKETIEMKTRDLFLQEYQVKLDQYIEYQGHIIRTLYRSHNKGVGKNMLQRPVDDMCSGLNAMFGPEKHSAVYSVIHSRTMEGVDHNQAVGLQYLKRLASRSGCDPVAALNMEPEYVKAILAPLGMLDHPILFITDHQRPEILDKLRADPEIGPNIRLIPKEASWVGGDITAAIAANVFIGNPASSFSGFIAKARLSMGFDKTYMFRKRNAHGKWVDACDARRIFDKNIMNKGMA